MSMFPQSHWRKQEFQEGSFCHLFSISLLCSPNLPMCSSQLLSPSLFQRTPDGFDSVPLKTSSGGPDMDLWGTLPCLTCLLTWAHHLASLWQCGCHLPATPAAGNLFVVALSEEVWIPDLCFLFIEYPNLPFCLPQTCQIYPHFVYILLPRLYLVSQNGPAVRAIASSAHISYCSGTKVRPFLSTETTPPVLLFQGRSSQEFPLIIALSSWSFWERGWVRRVLASPDGPSSWLPGFISPG